MTPPQPRDALDQALRAIRAAHLKPIPPGPPPAPREHVDYWPPLSPARARENLLTLMRAFDGSLQAADRDWLEQHPITDSTGD